MSLWAFVALPLCSFFVAMFLPLERRSKLGLLLAAVPATLFCAHVSNLLKLTAGLARSTALPLAHSTALYKESYEWIPSLGVNLSFQLDALGLLFSLLITGIGTLVFIYASDYMSGDKNLRKFYMALSLFLVAMQGLVISADLITMFLFWELTSISSFLLIGHKHDSEEARFSALRALLVTGLGGLALLAGAVLLGLVAGTYDLNQLALLSAEIKASPFYLIIFALCFLAAATKSAQMPFHFWLPGAMVAPTPVSSYLHSATMVKAGVFLMFRMFPVLGATVLWTNTLVFFGAMTMIVSIFMAFAAKDLKKILAYTTINALGTLIFLQGLGTPFALQAALVFVVAHALYKGALFMSAGIIDHDMGTRDVRQLGMLKTAIPMLFPAVLLAGFSMAGLPPFMGFVAKEIIYGSSLEAAHMSGHMSGWFTSFALLANAVSVSIAAVLALKIFLTKASEPVAPKQEQPAHFSWALYLGPWVLAVSSLVLGLWLLPLDQIVNMVLKDMAISTLGLEPLALWHGFNVPLLLSGLTLLLGAAFYFGSKGILKNAEPLSVLSCVGPLRAYEKIYNGVLRLADHVLSLSVTKPLRHYMFVIILFTITLLAWALYSSGMSFLYIDKQKLYLSDVLIALGIVSAAIAAMFARSRLAAIAEIGVIGLAMTFFFVVHGAPDLAMTQILVEILTTLLFVMVIFRLPLASNVSSRLSRGVDGVLAVFVAIVMGVATYFVAAYQVAEPISKFFGEASYLKADGKNVVNVILVDFRGLDTLGEITVLGVAAIAVFSLLRLNQREYEAMLRRQKKEGGQ
jgi:multicomponent Na+:H+ antiporter subunit A